MRSRPVIVPPDAPASDVEALTARVAELERSQRQEDCEGVGSAVVDGDNRPAGAGRPSYLWRRVDGEWLIVAGRNTAVVDRDGQVAAPA